MKTTFESSGHRGAKKSAGFSLFEMLITMAIFAILSSLALASFGNSTSAAKIQKDKRNAQLLAATASAASAAGASFMVEGDKQATILKLCEGCSPTQGIFKGRVFKFPSLAAEDLAAVMPYLKLNGGLLEYHSAGGQ
ncbi:MAG: type II secretion system protein [Verrucomicrobiaceae bacterium]